MKSKSHAPSAQGQNCQLGAIIKVGASFPTYEPDTCPSFSIVLFPTKKKINLLSWDFKPPEHANSYPPSSPLPKYGQITPSPASCPVEQWPQEGTGQSLLTERQDGDGDVLWPLALLVDEVPCHSLLTLSHSAVVLATVLKAKAVDL